jgi:hypothetical protein
MLSRPMSLLKVQIRRCAVRSISDRGEADADLRLHQICLCNATDAGESRLRTGETNLAAVRMPLRDCRSDHRRVGRVRSSRLLIDSGNAWRAPSWQPGFAVRWRDLSGAAVLPKIYSVELRRRLIRTIATSFLPSSGLASLVIATNFSSARRSARQNCAVAETYCDNKA